MIKEGRRSYSYREYLFVHLLLLVALLAGTFALEEGLLSWDGLNHSPDLASLALSPVRNLVLFVLEDNLFRGTLGLFDFL